MEEVDKESKYSCSPSGFLEKVLTLDFTKSFGDETIRKLSDPVSLSSLSLFTNLFPAECTCSFRRRIFLDSRMDPVEYPPGEFLLTFVQFD